jgi:hypothetical protein
MAKTQIVRWIAAATAFVAISLPRSSSAQFPFNTSLGTWTGFDTFDITVSNVSTGQIISSDSGSGPATLTIGDAGGIDTIAIEGGNVFPIIGDGPFIPSDPFGPTSASASINFDGGPAGFFSGNFFVTYESILPNGQIDVGNGSAVADLTAIEFNNPESFAIQTSIFATFTTAVPVPEPPSSVLAGLAILVIAAVAWMRSFRRRLQARLS